MAFLIHRHGVMEVGGSNPGCGTIVGVFHPTRQLVRFSLPNMLFILNLFSLRGEAVNYRPYEFPSFGVAKPLKITAILPIIIIKEIWSVWEFRHKMNAKPQYLPPLVHKL